MAAPATASAVDRPLLIGEDPRSQTPVGEDPEFQTLVNNNNMSDGNLDTHGDDVDLVYLMLGFELYDM